jgi:elongator complex protein 1
VLKDNGPNTDHIERTTLETRESRVVYQSAEPEQISSIFAGIGHQALWFSHASQHGRPVTYSSIDLIEGDEVDIAPWAEGPNVDTHWARAVSISDEEVKSLTLLLYKHNY